MRRRNCAGTNGRRDKRAQGHMSTWTYEHKDIWAQGHMGTGTYGHRDIRMQRRKPTICANIFVLQKMNM